MSYSRRSRYSISPLDRRYGRSMAKSCSMSRSRSRSPDAENPGNNLYVTGLSSRVTERELEKHFSTEGSVKDVSLVVDPWSRESRGFGFVTMSSVREADRCIKYLNNSVLEGRVITVEKARRRRGRTPTPGRYLGLRTVRARHRSSSYSPEYGSRSRSPQYSSERSRSRSYSPCYSRRRRAYSPYYRRRRSQSPYYSGQRSYSPYYRRRRSRSPYYSGRRSYSAYRRERSYSKSRSPYSRSPVSRRDRSYSPYYRDRSPEYGYRRSYRYRSRSISPWEERRYSRRSYSPSVSSGCSRSCSRSESPSFYSRSASPEPRRRSRRSLSRSVSPPLRKSSRRSYSRSISPRPRSSKRNKSPPSRGKRYASRDSYSSRIPVGRASSRSVSRSGTPLSNVSS